MKNDPKSKNARGRASFCDSKKLAVRLACILLGAVGGAVLGCALGGRHTVMTCAEATKEATKESGTWRVVFG